HHKAIRNRTNPHTPRPARFLAWMWITRSRLARVLATRPTLLIGMIRRTRGHDRVRREAFRPSGSRLTARSSRSAIRPTARQGRPPMPSWQHEVRIAGEGVDGSGDSWQHLDELTSWGTLDPIGHGAEGIDGPAKGVGFVPTRPFTSVKLASLRAGDPSRILALYEPSGLKQG